MNVRLIIFYEELRTKKWSNTKDVLFKKFKIMRALELVKLNTK